LRQDPLTLRLREARPVDFVNPFRHHTPLSLVSITSEIAEIKEKARNERNEARIACLFTRTLARSATIIAANRTCLSELARLVASASRATQVLLLASSRGRNYLVLPFISGVRSMVLRASNNLLKSLCFTLQKLEYGLDPVRTRPQWPNSNARFCSASRNLTPPTQVDHLVFYHAPSREKGVPSERTVDTTHVKD
jgi:hypothetical protein